MKNTHESFAVDAKLIGRFSFSCGVGLLKTTGEKNLLCSEQINKNEKKYFLWLQKGKTPDMLQNKARRRGGHFVRLIVEISKQQRHTARTKSCCLKGKDGAGKRGTWAAMWGRLLLSLLIYPVSREGALCSPGWQVSGGTSHAASSVGEAAVKGRCGKWERVKATPLCASAMEAESLPFITSSTGVLILVTVVFGREDSFWCLLIPENKRKKGCQGNRHPERLTENSG